MVVIWRAIGRVAEASLGLARCQQTFHGSSILFHDLLSQLRCLEQRYTAWQGGARGGEVVNELLVE